MRFGEKKYCGKYYRFMYFDEELETGIKCSIVLRGCYKN